MVEVEENQGKSKRIRESRIWGADESKNAFFYFLKCPKFWENRILVRKETCLKNGLRREEDFSQFRHIGNLEFAWN